MSARVGAFGDRVAVTPHLDRLAREGVRFSSVFAAAPVCAPSRAALVAGVHPISTGAQHMRTSTRPAGAYRSVPPPEVKAFPELLRAAGWFTFTDAKLDYQWSGVWSGTGPSTIWNEEGPWAGWDDRSDPTVPFFGWINFGVTHESGLFPALFEAWPRSGLHAFMQVARAWIYGRPRLDGPVPPDQVEVPPVWPDTPTVRWTLARHIQNIEQMDRQVGEILARLESEGLADSTIVIWTTDHGDGLPRAKRDLSDAGLHVPMIIRWPERLRPSNRAPGSVDDRLVSFVDLAPSVLRMAGLEPPDFIQGRDFLDDGIPPREFVFASRDRMDGFMDRERAVRDRRFKYIWSDSPRTPNGHPLAFRDHIDMVREMRTRFESGELDAAQSAWFEPTGRERLYDLERDPHEVRNLAASPEHADVLQRMRSALARWQARVPDWSSEPEDVMVERMWPGGRQPETAAPTIEWGSGLGTLSSATPGASIEFRSDGGPWQVYGGPTEADCATWTARAVRYGYGESEEVTFSCP